MADVVPAAPARPASPYVGLSYYTESEAEWFFGRDEECQTVIANLRAARLTVLYAQSGVGKSSLVRAGVSEQLLELSRRRLASRGALGYVPLVFSAWKDDPIDDLIDALQARLSILHPDEPPVDLPRASLDAACKAAADATGARILLVLDQFEEYLLYRGREPNDRRFVDEISRCITREDLRVNILIAIREDAYAELGDLFSGRIANVYGNHLQLAYLDRDAARECIIRPLEHFNQLVPDRPAIQVEPALIETVLDQVRTGEVTLAAPKADGTTVGGGHDEERIETPYLQLVMSALWAREQREGSTVLRLSTLDQLGGAQEIVRRHLQDALMALSSEERDAALAVFQHLVTPSGTKIVHAASDLAQMVGAPPERVLTTLEKLAGGSARIVRHVPPPAGRTTPEDRYEIFHDVLAPAIVDWRRRALEEHRRAERERLEHEKQAAEAAAHAERARARRFRLLATIAGVLLIATVIAALLANHEANRVTSEQRVALSRLAAGQSLLDLQSGIVPRGALFSVAAYQASPTPTARFGLVRALGATQGMLGYLLAGQSAVTSLGFSPDGMTVATANASGTLVLSDVATNRVVKAIRNPGSVALDSLAFSPNGRTVATGDDNGVVAVWSTATGQRMLALPSDGSFVNSVVFSPDGTTLAAGTDAGRVFVFDARSGKRLGLLRAGSQEIFSVAFSHDGQRLAVGAADLDHGGGTVTEWALANGRAVFRVRTAGDGVHSVAFAPGGGDLAYEGMGHSVVLADDGSGKTRMMLHGHTADVTGLAFSPDGSALVASSDDHTSIEWDPRDGQELGVQRAHTQPVGAVAFSPGGGSFATGSDDGSVILWAAHVPGMHQLIYRDPVLDAALSPSGQTLATGDSGNQVILRDVTTAQVLHVLHGHEDHVNGVAFSPDGTLLASASSDTRVMVWNVATGKRLHVLSGHSDTVWSVAFSPDGRTLVSTGNDNVAIVWDPRTGKRLHTLRGHSDAVYDAAFSPDGHLLATASQDRSVILWNTATWRPVRRLIGHAAAVEAVAFSPDGRILASAGDDRSIILWNPQTGARLGDPLVGSRTTISGLAFSPDGHVLASSSNDGSITLWDLTTRQGQPFGGHTAAALSVGFSQDGRLLYSPSLDHTVTVFDPTPTLATASRISEDLCNIARRSLTKAEWREFLPDAQYRRTCPGWG